MGCLTCSFRSVISNGKVNIEWWVYLQFSPTEIDIMTEYHRILLPKDPPFRRNGALRLKGLISWNILFSGFHDKEMPSSSWIIDDYSDASTLYQYKRVDLTRYDMIRLYDANREMSCCVMMTWKMICECGHDMVHAGHELPESQKDIDR